MVAVIWVARFLLTVVWFLWFRRTPMYRAHRRIGVVSGQSGVGGVPGQSAVGNTPRWYGDRHVPPLLPELRPDRDQTTPRARRWQIWRNRRPSAASALAERRGHRSVKVLLSERSMRRGAAKQLAVRRLPVAQDPNMRREFKPEGAMANRIHARSAGLDLRRFFSPNGHSRGRVAGILSCAYLAVTALLIVSAILEGYGDSYLTVDLAFMVTWPLSLGVVAAPNDSPWMLAALGVCALVNAFVFWVVCRGDPA